MKATTRRGGKGKADLFQDQNKLHMPQALAVGRASDPRVHHFSTSLGY